MSVRVRAGLYLHEAGTHEHAGFGAAAATDLAHALWLGMRVELVDQRQAWPCRTSVTRYRRSGRARN